MSSGIIMALIIIVLIDSKENFCNSKEGFAPKIKVWRSCNFLQLLVKLDLDREIKITNSERSNFIIYTKQLDQSHEWWI